MLRAVSLALLLLVASAFAEQLIIVRRIDIDGLHRTRRWVVERELGFAVGDTITTADLQTARNRLENLSIFNSVYIYARAGGVIHVRVPELWPLWPVLSVSVYQGRYTDILTNPGDFFKRATISVGGTYINTFGTAAKTYAVFDAGAVQGVDLEYGTRWFSPHFPYAVQLGFQNLHETTNRVAVHDSVRYLVNIKYSADVATRAGAPSRIGLKVRYWQVHVETGQPNGEFLPELKRYRTVWLGPYVILDRRDLEWYPSRGAYSENHVELVTGNTQFIRSFYDLRGYFPLSQAERPTVAALRLSAATSTTSTPRWAHYFYPFGNSLRGYNDTAGEAANFIVADAELRVPIGPETTYTVPYIGHYGKDWPWGLAALLFAERGELRLSGQRDERTAFGGGLYIRVPYFEIFEASATVRATGRVEYNLSTGVAF
jgi:outer membrane protein assembly factor BamA